MGGLRAGLVSRVRSITAAQVLEHVWIKGSAPDTELDLDNLKKLNASRKLKKAGQKLMALNRVTLLKAAAAAESPRPPA